MSEYLWCDESTMSNVSLLRQTICIQEIANLALYHDLLQ